MKNEEIDEECVWTRKKGEKSGIGRVKKEWKRAWKRKEGVKNNMVMRKRKKDNLTTIKRKDR